MYAPDLRLQGLVSATASASGPRSSPGAPGTRPTGRGWRSGRSNGNPVFAFFGPYEEVGFEVGLRFYISTAGRLKSYIAPVVGARSVNEILVSFSVPDAGSAILNVPFNQKSTVAVFGLDLGFTFDLGEATSSSASTRAALPDRRPRSSTGSTASPASTTATARGRPRSSVDRRAVLAEAAPGAWRCCAPPDKTLRRPGLSRPCGVPRLLESHEESGLAHDDEEPPRRPTVWGLRAAPPGPPDGSANLDYSVEIDRLGVMSSPSLDDFTKAEYKAGFVTDIEQETLPPGPVRGRRAPHLGEEGRARVDDRVAAQGLPALAHDGGADVAERPLPADRLPGDLLLLAPKQKKDAPKSLDEVDPKLLETYEKLGRARSTSGRSSPASRSTPSSTASPSPPRSRTKLKEAGVIFCSFSEAVKEHPELVRKYLGTRRPVLRQLLRRPQLRGLLRRLLRLRAEGRALPDGAQHLLPHQRLEHRPVRAHADRGRRGRLRQLPRGLHGADARREPAARGGGRARRARRRRRSSTRPCRTGTPATRTARAASTTS